MTWTELAVLLMVLERVGMFVYGAWKTAQAIRADRDRRNDEYEAVRRDA